MTYEFFAPVNPNLIYSHFLRCQPQGQTHVRIPGVVCQNPVGSPGYACRGCTLDFTLISALDFRHIILWCGFWWLICQRNGLVIRLWHGIHVAAAETILLLYQSQAVECPINSYKFLYFEACPIIPIFWQICPIFLYFNALSYIWMNQKHRVMVIVNFTLCFKRKLMLF